MRCWLDRNTGNVSSVRFRPNDVRHLVFQAIEKVPGVSNSGAMPSSWRSWEDRRRRAGRSIKWQFAVGKVSR